MDGLNNSNNDVLIDLNNIYKSLTWLKEQSWIANFHRSENWFFEELNTIDMLVLQLIQKMGNSNGDDRRKFSYDSSLSDQAYIVKFRFCSLMQNLKNCPLVEGCFNKENIFCQFRCPHSNKKVPEKVELELYV